MWKFVGMRKDRDTVDTLRSAFFRPLRAANEKIAVLETSQSATPIAALRLLRRTIFPKGKIIRSRSSHQTKKGILHAGAFLCLVGESGFEPLKQDATDLQSAPFGHSGTLPYGAGERNRTINLLITNQLLCQLSYASVLTPPMLIATRVVTLNSIITWAGFVNIFF